MFQIYNTLSRQIEEFKPLNPEKITIYSCGPTVYDYAHIGNLRTYTNIDLLKRSLIYLGYKVNQVMNITDVGHLTGDDDSGEDKLEKGAKKANKTVLEIAEYYTKYFFYSTEKLNILKPEIVAKVTDNISEIIALIKILEKKGYTYQTQQAIYFDISQFKSYGLLSKQKLDDKIKQARPEVVSDPQKKHPADFALWFFLTGRFRNHQLKWSSPWGAGFPGWHIECSAIAMKYLGPTIDIHTGGIEHLPVHHENEIAQSQAATNQQFVRLWFHNNHLLINNTKMSKSLDNFYNIDDITNKNYNPISLRYLFLQTHYRQQANFTWDALKAASISFNKLIDFVLTNKELSQNTKLSKKGQGFQNQFIKSIQKDLNIPQALAILWQVINSGLSFSEKYQLAINFDNIFGLGLINAHRRIIPKKIIKLADERLKARLENDFTKADRIRTEIEKKGYQLIDTTDSYQIK